jgi:hypothetical protein
MTTTPRPTPPPERTPLYPVSQDGRTRIRIGSDPDTIRVLTAALDARVIPDTYVTDGTPVVVEAVSGAADPTAGDEDVPLPLVASALKPPLLAALLAHHTEIIQPRTLKGTTHDEEVSPTRDNLAAVLARRSWEGLPVLRRIISTPVLRPDGTLLQTPGYDPATGFLLASNQHLDPIPEHPSTEMVDAAREFLLDRFLADFPWRNATADRANYLGLLVTPIIRPFTRSLSPFAVIDATMPGSGKTILTGCVGLLVGQRVLTWNDSEDEQRKQITTVMADQVGAVVWDNLKEGTVIDSAALARLITERTWTDRRLGGNQAASYPNNRLWLATGNNLRVGGDMASRSVWVRLDPDCPHPEARTGFAIENLDTWILDPVNRATVLRHLLVLILDWTAAGAPSATGLPAMRQFTRWAQMVGGFLAHHGVTGFLDNAEAGRELDESAAEWRTFLLHWRTIFADRPVSAKELRASAEPEFGSDPWAGTFPTTAGGKLLTVKSIGRLLTGQLDRWRENVVLRSEHDAHDGMRRYWVQHAEHDTPPDPEAPQPPQQLPIDLDEWDEVDAVFAEHQRR